MSHAYFLISPKPGRALLRDEEIHVGNDKFGSFVRKIHELIHDVLVVDFQAAELVNLLAIGCVRPNNGKPLAFAVGSVVRWLDRQTYYVSEEKSYHNGVTLLPTLAVGLVRYQPRQLRPPATHTTSLTSDGYTQTFTFK